MLTITQVRVNAHQERPATKGRIYVNPTGETVLANLANRRSRPYNEYRKLFPQIRAELAEQGYDLPETAKISWSQYAGCSCPCSPGFIVQGLHGHNVFVDVNVA